MTGKSKKQHVDYHSIISTELSRPKVNLPNLATQFLCSLTALPWVLGSKRAHSQALWIWSLQVLRHRQLPGGLAELLITEANIHTGQRSKVGQSKPLPFIPDKLDQPQVPSSAILERAACLLTKRLILVFVSGTFY